MAIAALIISICSVIFAGIVAMLSFKEQKLRLRPYVFVSGIDNNTFDVAITNCGLLPAKKATISVIQRFNNQVIEQPSSSTKYSIILPNQILYTTVEIDETTKSQMLQGKIQFAVEIEIKYYSNGVSYFYKVIYDINPKEGWVVVEADAD